MLKGNVIYILLNMQIGARSLV